MLHELFIAVVIGAGIYFAARKAIPEGILKFGKPPADAISRRFSVSAQHFDAAVTEAISAFVNLVQRLSQHGVSINVGTRTGGILPDGRPFEDENVPELGSILALMDSGAFEEATIQLRVLNQQRPDNARVMSLLGKLLLEQKNFDEAIKVFQKLLTLEPRSSEISHHLAISYYWQGVATNDESLLHMAERQFVHAIDAGSIEPQTGMFLGLVRWKLKMHPQALEATRAALKLANRTLQVEWQAKAMNNIAYYLFEIADQAGPVETRDTSADKDQINEASELIERAIKLKGSSERFHDTKGCIELWKHNGEAAQEHFAAALAKFPTPLYADHFARAHKLARGR